ncbi:MAG TPA: MFS transporter [Acidimicrobiales bacterium]|nr:MFS transporter [Acidimicrobiales bacterium]
MDPSPDARAGTVTPLDRTLAVSPSPDVYARRWRTLGVLCLSLMIVMVGNISLNVALPAIARDLDASTSDLQWMVDAYALVFAGLLFAAGTLGDRFGRKGALQSGLVLFLVGAVLATSATTVGLVVAARAVMGVAAALVMPSTLSILANVFPAEERGRAIAVWAAIAAGGGTVGPIGSGLLLEHFWWGSVFLVNVPLVVVALVAGRWLVPTSKDPGGHPLDIPGALASIAAVGLAVYAIIEGPTHGWLSRPTAVAVAAAGVALGLFVARELTARSPMLDLRLFRDRRFGVASGGIALAYFALFGTFFLITQYLQLVLGHTALEAGVILLPVPAILLTVSPRIPRLVERFGPAPVVGAGLSLIAAGLVAMAQLTPHSPLALFYLAFVPMATGIAATGTPLTTLLMAAVPPGRSGIGSAMNDTSRELGGALGIAVLGSIVTSRFAAALAPATAALPPAARDLAGTGLAGALRVAGDLPRPAATALAGAARGAFVEGLSTAALVAAAVAGVAALGAAALLPRRPPVLDDVGEVVDVGEVAVITVGDAELDRDRAS